MNLFKVALWLSFWLIGCQDPTFPKTIAIVGANVLNPPVTNSVILVQGDRIFAIGVQQSVPIPPNSSKVNATGKRIQSQAPLVTGAPASFTVLSENNQVERTMKGGQWLNQ